MNAILIHPKQQLEEKQKETGNISSSLTMEDDYVDGQLSVVWNLRTHGFMTSCSAGRRFPMDQLIWNNSA